MLARLRFDAAVAATILGIIVSGTMWYLDREQKKSIKQKKISVNTNCKRSKPAAIGKI